MLTFGNVRHVQGRVVRGSINKSIKSPTRKCMFFFCWTLTFMWVISRRKRKLEFSEVANMGD